MRQVSKLFLIALMASLLPLFAGCATKPGTPVPTAMPEADASLIWSITVDESELTSNISSTKAFVEYGGEVNEVSFSDQPSEGNVYLLVRLSIDKHNPGKEKFLWSELSVVDANNTAYSRHDNDTFLELHGLPRIKATDLSIGNNHGYICFELPASVDSSHLTLVYAQAGSAQRIALSPSDNRIVN